MFNFEHVSPDDWVSDEELWRDRLAQLPHWNHIPLLNANPLHYLTDQSIVRFRGMIQDMHNAEFYFEKFEVLDSTTNEIKIKSGKYRDLTTVKENEKLNAEKNLKSSQRHTMVLVSIPGLNEWVQNIEDDKNHLDYLAHKPDCSKPREDMSKLKRPYDELESMDNKETDIQTSNKTIKIEENKEVSTPTVSREHILNFPLPDIPSMSCIAKIYSPIDDLKLNDMVEIVGFLSVDPALSGEFHQSEDSILDVDVESSMEKITLNPPPSLVPRIHVVHFQKLSHCNPLMSREINHTSILNSANATREHLLKALTELLLGDQLAAEYLICHLISSIYMRHEGLVLGQFCLNISNLPTEKYANYAKQLYDIIRQFVTKSYYLPLTLDNMINLALVPKKDYDCNRLTSGILQLTKNTHLVLDETKMSQGTLDSSGLHNVMALKNLIENQRVEYDFNYYKMPFESDISVLVLSDGKSLLPSDYHVPLRPEKSSLDIFNAIVEAAKYYLKEDIMNNIRTYITTLKFVDCTITNDLKFVEDDFIKMRGESSIENPVTVDDLHKLLVLARLVSLSRGHSTLNKECWDIAKKMESDRMQRVKNRAKAVF